ncbi:MAG: VacB/RNase II family 3'-5' exoribonuclease [Phycisphaerales bacterium]|nr:MAG: VacB/RNase II family 3'-5' exoribonuclease [Phycisphaerales bacterium]
MPLRYKNRLLSLLAHDAYEPSTVPQLAEQLRADEPEKLAEAVRQLVEAKVVAVDPRGLVRLPSYADLGTEELVGEFRSTTRGFGFVVPEVKVREGDLFIPERETGGAMHGDTVRVEFWPERGRGPKGEQRFAARVVEVLLRRRAAVTGTLFKRDGKWYVAPDGKDFQEPVVVRDAESKNAKEGLKVALELLEFPQAGQLGEGVITKVLGEAGRPDVETQAVIEAHGLPSNEFPEACVEQARKLTRQFEADIERFEREGPGALDGRLDLTDLFPDHPDSQPEFITTIDPPDAKDYDDAIHIRKTKDGWELGVHIADVGYFIDPGTALDVDGKDRGNSVYLPRHVIPMLPEVLSNGICSLQEGVCRFAKSAFMRYDREGNLKASGVASTVIKSAKRMTYLEAQALIDGDQEEARKHAKTDTPYTEQLIAAVREMNALARMIRARRQKQGMITLDLPEVELIFDEDGKVVDAEREDDAYTHKIIEMFMVEANEVLARLFENMDVPLLRRTHADPTPGDQDNLRRAAMVAGFRIPASPSREEMQSLLDATAGTPAARAVHMAVLRTLSKASYSPALIGHFALASEAYAHFTSPIRRYPDLTVHRALGAYLRETDNGKKRPRPDDEKALRNLGIKLLESGACPSQEELVEIGRHCSKTEERATAAERELRQFLVLQLLETKIGESFSAVVTGVTPRGVFVQIDKYLADGLILKEDLPGDTSRGNQTPKWSVDRRTGALVDEHSGRSFNMGDSVTVRISDVDLSRRQMNVVVDDPDSRAAGKAKTPKIKLGEEGGGLAPAEKGAGFKSMTGSERRSAKSKRRDKGKTDYRRDKKK